MKKFAKRTRLSNFNYQGTYAYSITITTDYRKNFFSDYQNVDLVLPILKRSCEEFYFQIYVYCFMPDHLHILLKGEGYEAELKKCVNNFKQKSGFVFKQKNKCNLWQPSYYDHILRKDEDLLTVARYILLNPVRKGLVHNFKEYSFSGSQVFQINDL